MIPIKIIQDGAQWQDEKLAVSELKKSQDIDKMLVQVGHHHPKNITIIITVIAVITFALLGDSPSLSSSSPRHYQELHIVLKS